jgi:hypothetical protein
MKKPAKLAGFFIYDQTVIPSIAKNLIKAANKAYKILRFAQNDKKG